MMKHFYLKKIEVKKKKLDFAFYSIILKYSDDWFSSAKSGNISYDFWKKNYAC